MSTGAIAVLSYRQISDEVPKPSGRWVFNRYWSSLHRAAIRTNAIPPRYYQSLFSNPESM